MREIELENAQVTLSALVDDAVARRPSIVTRGGKKLAVVLSCEDYQNLSGVPSFGWMLTHSPIEDGDLPERGPHDPLNFSDI